MKCIMSLRLNARIVAVSGWIFAIAIAWLLPIADVRAEVRISGSKDAVTVDARNAPFTEIIAALNSGLVTRISYTPTINPAITGTYSGSLRRVLLRMLDGQNFVLSSSGDQISIILATNTDKNVLRRPVATPVSSQSPANNSSRANAGKNVAAADDELNTSGVQGWVGGFSVNLPAIKNSK